MAEKVTFVPSTLVRYSLDRSVVTSSAQKMRELSAGVRESVVLWAGRVIDQTHARITRMIVPDQDTSRFHFDIPLDERLRILDELSAIGELVLIQLHTHPRRAFHSPADDRMAITKHTGAISIVVPDFGLYWNGDLGDCSVHRCLGAARWEQISPAEVKQLFEVNDELQKPE